MLFGIRKKPVLSPSRLAGSSESSTGDYHKHQEVRSQGSLKGFAIVVQIAGKTLYDVCASKLLSPHHSSVSELEKGSHKSQTLSIAGSSTSIGSSNSTAPTEFSLRIPDCGARFTVPGVETSPDPKVDATDPRVSVSTPVNQMKVDVISTLHKDSAHDSSSQLHGPHVRKEYIQTPTEAKHSLLRNVGRRLKDKLMILHQRKPIHSADRALSKPQDEVLEIDGKRPSNLSDVFLSSGAADDNTKLADSNHDNSVLKVSEEILAEIATVEQELEHPGQEEGDEAEEDEDEDEDDDEDEYPRCDFKTIEAIPDSKFEGIIQASFGLQDTEDVRVTHRAKGTYNLAVFVELCRGGNAKEYVIRVPGHGTEEHWMPEDAYMLEREADLLTLICERTSAPVPQVLNYSANHENSLGFPFILMNKLPGKTAWNIWFDQPYDPEEANYAYRTADVPSVETEKKRLTFLRSLARMMNDVQAISFNKIGMPIVPRWSESSFIGPSYHWPSDGSDQAIARAPAKSTQEYIQRQLNSNFKRNSDGVVSESKIRADGIRQILDVIFSLPVFNSSQPETFTIHHNDLDLQNILVDDDGNVTGIIDWDKSIAAPRCIGAAAVPLFLRNDWFPRYTHDLRLSPHMAWNYQHYREIYAAAMVEAGNITDAKFTMKSAIYQSAIAAITEGGDANDLIEKLLRQIPHCLVDADDFKLALGCGWPAAIDMLKTQLAKIFEPALPRCSLLRDLDTDLAMREWMSAFDAYTTTGEQGDEARSGGEPRQ